MPEFTELTQPLPEPQTKPCSSWLACIKRVFELDPLKCPKCNASMRIVAFITDPAVIKKISAALGLPQFSAPEKIPRAPPTADHYTDLEHFN